ncbi:MAG: signal recognition particle receptor subunit alpha, partial [Thiotrichaceae bacterium]
MFDNLNERLSQTVKKIRGQARLTDDNIKDTLREVRMALLEADVALPVVRSFIDKVRERAVGQEVVGSLNPGQALIKVVDEELVEIMGKTNESLDLKAQPPAVILMAGLQGAGKTTTAAKLAKLLKERENKSVSVVSCDVYRPAAIKQLEMVASEVGATFIPSDAKQSPIKIAKAALKVAKKSFAD